MEENRNPEVKPARSLSRRTFLKAALGTSGIVLLTACSSAPAPAPTAAPAAPAPVTQPTAPGAAQPAPTKAAAPAAQPTAMPAPAPAKPQKPVVIAQGVEMPSLDPQFSESGALANITTHIFDTLISFDRNMKVVPDAAESFQMLPDQKTWQFKLRKGMKFWNGENLDAKAVKFTFDRIGNADLRKQGLNDPYYSRVGYDHIDIVDDYTVNFVLKAPSILFPVFTTFNPILAPDYYSKHTIQETAIAPMGTGPWMFKEWVKDDHMTLVANPNYWQGKPQIETVIIKVVPESSTRLAMLQTGEVDVVQDLVPEDLPRVEADKNLRVGKSEGGRRVYFVIPTEKPLWKDRRVRLAMNMAVDFDAINKAILGGLAYGRMTDAVNGVWSDPSIKPYAYDPEKAKQLLKDAGWDPNTKVTMFTSVGRYMKDKEMAQAVAGYLQKIGMKAEVDTMEWTIYSEKGRKGEWDMPNLTGRGSRFFGPDDLNGMINPGFQGWEWVDSTQNGPQAKKLYEELSGTLDEVKQKELVKKISQLYVEEAPWISLWKQVSIFGISRRINWEPSGNYRVDFWLAGEKDTQVTS